MNKSEIVARELAADYLLKVFADQTELANVIKIGTVRELERGIKLNALCTTGMLLSVLTVFASAFFQAPSLVVIAVALIVLLSSIAGWIMLGVHEKTHELHQIWHKHSGVIMSSPAFQVIVDGILYRTSDRIIVLAFKDAIDVHLMELRYKDGSAFNKLYKAAQVLEFDRKSKTDYSKTHQISSPDALVTNG